MKTENRELLNQIILFVFNGIIYFAVYGFLFIYHSTLARFFNGARAGDFLFVVSSWHTVLICCAYLSFFITRFIIINFFYFYRKTKNKDVQHGEEQNENYSIKSILTSTVGNKFNMVLAPVAAVALLLCLLNAIKINESGVAYKSFFGLTPRQYKISDIHSIEIDVYAHKKETKCNIFLCFEDDKIDIWQDATMSSPDVQELISVLELIKAKNKYVMFKSDWEPTEEILEYCTGRKKDSIMAMYEYAKGG